MTRKKALAIIEEIFKSILDDEDLVISEDTEFKDIEGFDSVMQITMIGSLESELGRKFSLKEMVGLKNVHQLVDMVTKK